MYFVETEDDIDLLSTLNIVFYADGKQIKKVNVDKNGIFYFDSNMTYYKVSSGSFDYNYVKNIYQSSQHN